MKTFDKEDVYSWANVNSADSYIEQEGYFGNSFQELEKHINDDETAILLYIFESKNVNCVFKNERNISYGLFIPKDKVKEVEEPKNWRAFKTIEEFFDIYNKNVGSLITYRVKANPLREITASIMGYIKEATREDQLQIGVATFQLSTWHEVTEIWNEDEESWQPFGVEE